MTRDDLFLVMKSDRTVFYQGNPVKVVQVSYYWSVAQFAMVRSSFNLKAPLVRVGFDELSATPETQEIV